MTTTRRGATLVVLGVALLTLTLVLGPAFAPTDESGSLGPTPDATTTPAGTENASDAPPRTIVGVQGVGSYSADGYVAVFEGKRRAWRANTSGTYFDVDYLDDGTVLAAFMRRGYEQCGPYESPCARTGYRVLDPETGAVIEEWTFPVRHHTNSEVHDVDALPGGGYVVADMEHERVFVRRDGEITWQWNASSRYDAPADPTKADWLHINDVDRIAEGRYLVSVRNANQILVVDEEEGVVEVINEDRDGDGKGDSSILYRQHNPQWLGDGAVLVADSENHRIVELHRIENGTWRPAWTLTRADGEALDWPRDADRLPDGTTLVSDTRNARVLLVNESGAVLWQKRLDYRAIPYEADRVSFGEPVGAPRYDVGNAAPPPDDDASELPVVTPLYRLLSAVVRLPRWFGEPHLVSVLVSVVLVGAGSIVRLADLRR